MKLSPTLESKTDSKTKKQKKPKAPNVNEALRNLRVADAPPPTKTTVKVKQLVEQVCSIVDPFCPQARGAKYPDDSSARTLTFTVQQETVIPSDVSGKLCVWIAPALNYSSIVNSFSIVGDVCNAGPMDAPLVAKLAGVSRYRIVSAGYRIKNVAPALTAAGMISFRGYGQEAGGSTLETVTGNSYAASYVRNIALQDVHNEVVICQHTSQPAQVFYDPAVNTPTSSLVDWTAPGFGASTIYGTGLPIDTACIHVEFIMHVEFIFGEGSALQLAATPSIPFNPVVKEMAARMTSSAEGVFASSAEAFGHWARTKLTNMLLNKLNTGPPRAQLLGAFASKYLEN